MKKTYIHARYKDTFEVKEEESAVLLERIKRLLHTVGEEFERIVHSIKVPSDEAER